MLSARNKQNLGQGRARAGISVPADALMPSEGRGSAHGKQGSAHGPQAQNRTLALICNPALHGLKESGA